MLKNFYKLGVAECSPKLFATALLLIIFVQLNFSQTTESIKKDEFSPEVKKEAIVLLRETASEVANMRTLENRISLSAEMANLMWFNEEKEARAMFQIVISDFRQLLSNYDAQLNSLSVSPETSDEYSPDTIDTSNSITRKFYKAISVRQQIAKALAEHDPQLAYEFFTESATAVSNPTFRKQIEGSDSYFEVNLLNQIAEKNTDTALKYGRKTLAKGFNPQVLNLLRKIYEKDAEKGASFAEEVVSKLKTDASKPEGFYSLTSVLSLGVENLDSIKAKPGKRPMFSEQSLRDIADLTAQELLKREDTEGYDSGSYIEYIERFAPSRATQLRQKFSIKKNRANVVRTAVTVPPPPSPKPQNFNPLEEKQKQLTENLQNLEAKKLSDDERKKVVEQSRKIIAANSNREQKIAALSGLAVQIARLGDKELASDVMNEVRSLVNLQPKNYREYMEIWLLAGSYSQIDSSKTFPILEDTIFRLNDTIAAFVKVGEFIDASNEMIDDGEIQIGSFGGDISRDLFRGLGSSDMMIRSLAIADFPRTKALSEKFDRPEARILAKMLILRTVLAGKAEDKVKEDF